MDYILDCRDVSFSYHAAEGETHVIDHISFQIEPGSFTAIVGPSGCGKSTLLSLLCGLLKPEEGTILIHVQRIGYMFQHDHLLPWRTVLDNALLGPEMQHCKTKEKITQVQTQLTRCGLGPFLKAKPSALSGGMRQKTALIRTLATDPELLLLDEPFSALDYQTRLELSDDLGSMIRSTGITAILVTHDLSEAISLADKILILTKRPASVASIMNLAFPLKDGTRPMTPLERRNESLFPDYFQKLWKEVRQ